MIKRNSVLQIRKKVSYIIHFPVFGCFSYQCEMKQVWKTDPNQSPIVLHFLSDFPFLHVCEVKAWKFHFYLLQLKELKLSPAMQTPFHRIGTGSKPSSLKLSASGQIPSFHTEI